MYLSLLLDGDLSALIKARQSSREQDMGSFFDNLEQKYASGSGKKGSKKKNANSKSTGSRSSGEHSKTKKGKSRSKK